MVEARDFTMYTDHKPFSFAFHSRKENCSPRQLRHLDLIAQLTMDISSKNNLVADTLSRIEEISQPVTAEKIALAQRTDQELEEILKTDSSVQSEKASTLHNGRDGGKSITKRMDITLRLPSGYSY